VTISLGLLLLIAGFLCYRAKGAQLPYMILGALIVKAAGSGSLIDDLAVTGVDVVQRVVSAVAEAFGQSGIV
jgi:tagatose-1,6-bisphosphate aldolase non-catalytic subunit AgaZ/GatZ